MSEHSTSNSINNQNDISSNIATSSPSCSTSGKDEVANSSNTSSNSLPGPMLSLYSTPPPSNRNIQSHNYNFRHTPQSTEEQAQIELSRRYAVVLQRQLQHERETSHRHINSTRSSSSSFSSSTSSSPPPFPSQLLGSVQQNSNISNSRPGVTEIANHGSLFLTVPFQSRSKFQYHSSIILSQYKTASNNKDFDEMTNCIAKLLQLPNRILNKHTKHHSAQTRADRSDISNNNTTEEKEEEEGNEVGLDEEEHIESESEENTVTLASTNSSDAEDRIIRKVIALIRSKHVGRAARVLARPKQSLNNIMRNTEQLVNKLKLLHPQPPTDATPPSLPTHPTYITIKLEDTAQAHKFRQMIQRTANGSAPGLSGWTGDMLKVLYDDENCRIGLAQLIADICNGELPDQAKDYILPSHLVPIPKPNQPSSVRPISMGEIFYRAAAHYAVSLVSDVIADVLGPIQFGVGRPAGIEQAVHRLQHLLTQSQPYLAGIAVDFKNAFNERSRKDVLAELYKYDQLQPIWNIVKWAYSDPSALWIRDYESQQMIQPDSSLTSAEGVKQGDPLGALLFALSMKSIYDKAVQSDATGSIKAIAYLDDCTLIGLPDAKLLKAFEVLRKAAKEGGLEVNISKTKFLWLHESTVLLPTDIETKLAQMNIEIERGASVLLGAPIGTDAHKMQSIVMNIVKEQEQFFDRIKSPLMPIQQALILLRSCALPRLNYLMRTTPASALAPAAKAFDELMYNTLNTKLNLHLPTHIDTSPSSSSSCSSSASASSSSSSSSSPCFDPASLKARLQLSLPLHLSGLGLRSIIETMNFAYIASYVRVIYEDEEWWKTNGPTEYNNFTFINRVDEVIELIHTKLPGQKHKQLYPQQSDMEGIIDFIHKTKAKEKKEIEERKKKHQLHRSHSHSILEKLQRELGHAYGKEQLHRLAKSCSHDRDYHRICCLSQKGTSSHQWLLALPSDPTLYMRDVVMKQSIRYRLGLNPYDNNIHPPLCLCGKKDVYQQNPYHSLSCSALRHHGTNRRHNLLVNNLATWITRAGAMVQIEMTGMSSEDKKRPDIVFWVDKEQYVIDVTVTDPFNATNMKRIGPIPLPISDINTTNIDDPTQNNNHLTSQHFAYYSAQQSVIFETMEKRKNKHYQKLVNANQSFCPTTFFTAGALTTGGLCKEFTKLIQLISIFAQHHRGGWDPLEIIEGIRNGVAVSIQEGNSIVINDTWNRIAERNMNSLLRGEKERPMRCRRRQTNHKENRNGTSCDGTRVNESEDVTMEHEMMSRRTTSILSAAQAC